MTPSDHDDPRAPATVSPAAPRSQALLLMGIGIPFVVAQILLASSTRGLTHATATTVTSVLPLIMGLALPTALLLLVAGRIARLTSSQLVILAVFLVGLAMRAIWLGVTPPLEDDFYRYLWDGAVLAHGLTPYAHAPLEFLGPGPVPSGYEGLAASGRGVLPNINFPDLRTIYPSTALTAFGVAHLLAPFDVDGLRWVFLVGEATTFLLMLRLLVGIGASPLWSVLYWWNPTIVYCLIGIVHVDALVPPLVLGALLAIRRDRIALAVTLLGIAAGVKFWPALLVMLALATVRGDWARLARCVAVALAVHAVSVGPVLISPLQPASGLGAYASGWAINNAPFAWAVLLLGEFFGEASAQWVLRALAAVAGCAAALLVAYHSNGSLRSVLRGSLLVAAMVFYLSPAQFPWYAVWFLAPAAAMQNWPLLMASVSLPVYYLFFPLAATGRADYFQLGLAFIHVLPVLVAAVAAKLRRQ